MSKCCEKDLTEILHHPPTALLAAAIQTKSACADYGKSMVLEPAEAGFACLAQGF